MPKLKGVKEGQTSRLRKGSTNPCNTCLLHFIYTHIPAVNIIKLFCSPLYTICQPILEEIKCHPIILPR